MSNEVSPGVRLRALRDALGMTREQVACAEGVGVGAYVASLEERAAPTDGADAFDEREVESVLFGLGVALPDLVAYVGGRMSLGDVLGRRRAAHDSAPTSGVLSDSAIAAAVASGQIVLEPFKRRHIGPNSYDVHLHSVLSVYDRGRRVLDARKPCPLRRVSIPPKGLVLRPGRLYLGSTVERTESLTHVPRINGRSSVGRLGIRVHATAGDGDVGFRGHWTLEIDVVEPVRVYTGMPIAQILWTTVAGPVLRPYGARVGSKYQHQGALPVASMMHRNFEGRPGRGR